MKAIKFFAAIAFAAFVVSCGASASSETITYKNKKGTVDTLHLVLPTDAEIDSVSYLIGINFGSFIKGNGFAEDLKGLHMGQIKKGMEDFLKAEGNPYDPEFGKQFEVNPDQMQRILNEFLTKKMEYKKGKNKAKEVEFLAKNALKENVKETESGLQYTIIAEGAEEKVGPRDTVWVNYKGTLLDETVFDENDSTRFIANRMIPGFTEGLCLLGEGGKATLYIPSDLAYGENGNRGIEPNSTLIFDVEVLSVHKFMPKAEEPAKSRK